MADIFSAVVQAPAVVPHVKHIAHHAASVAPIVKQGVSMLTILISNLVSAAVAGGLTWYIRGRGMTGVKQDISNAQAEIAKLKAQVSPPAVV